MISGIRTFVQEHLLIIWFVVIPLISSVICLKTHLKCYWVPPIAVAASVLLQVFVNPLLFSDLFGTPVDDFSFVSVYWLLSELILFVPSTLLWMLGCHFISKRANKTDKT